MTAKEEKGVGKGWVQEVGRERRWLDVTEHARLLRIVRGDVPPLHSLGILTAMAAGPAPSGREGLLANEALECSLGQPGYQRRQVAGDYGSFRNPIVVTNIDRDSLLATARSHHMEKVVHGQKIGDGFRFELLSVAAPHPPQSVREVLLIGPHSSYEEYVRAEQDSGGWATMSKEDWERVRRGEKHPVQTAIEYREYVRDTELKGNKPLPKWAWMDQQQRPARSAYCLSSSNGPMFRIPFFDRPEPDPAKARPQPRMTIPGHVVVGISEVPRVTYPKGTVMHVRWKEDDRGVIQAVPASTVPMPLSYRSDLLLKHHPELRGLVERLWENQAQTEEVDKTGKHYWLHRCVVRQTRQMIDACLQIKGVCGDDAYDDVL